MKNLSHSSKIILCACFLFMGLSCQKEKAIVDQKNSQKTEFKVASNIDYSKVKIVSKGFRGKQASTNLLWFENIGVVQYVLADLARQVTDLDNAFLNQYGHLDEEALNEKEEEIGFNEEKPLFDFANHFNFYSLHMKLFAEEEEWLDHEDLNFNTDPDNHFIFEDEVRAILNTDEEVMIGNVIYKYTQDGYFEVANRSFDALAALDNNNRNYLNLPAHVNFVGDNGTRGDGCNSTKRKWGHKKSSDGEKRIKYVVSHWTHIWGRRAAAKVDNYKKKRKRWKKYRTYCEAKVFGYISDDDGDCEDKEDFNPNNAYANASNKKHVEHKISVSTKTKSGWITGYFHGAGISYTKTLTW